MVFYNGDRVCILSGDTLKFGRVQEYVEEPASQMTPDSPPKVISNEELLKIASSTKAGDEFLSPAVAKKRFVSCGESGKKGQTVKRQIAWDDNKGTVELKPFHEGHFKVIDRKFTIGQRVFRCGFRGKVAEVIPLATVKICDNAAASSSNNKKPKNQVVSVVPDLSVTDIKPISSIFNGVNIEFNGWIGQVTEVRRNALYKLQEPVGGLEEVTCSIYDSIQLKSSRYSSSVTTAFTYPYMEQGTSWGNPYKGQVTNFNKMKLQQYFGEVENKENSDSTFLETSTQEGVNSPAASPSIKCTLSITERRRNRAAAAREIVTATVESVSVASIKVRWTGRLPVDLIKPPPDEKAKKTLFATIQQPFTTTGEKMPPSFICEADIAFVRPLYVHPTMYFDKKGLSVCNSITKGMIIPEKQWASDLYKSLACRTDAHLAPFDFNSVVLSPPRPPRAARRALIKDFEKSSNDQTTGKRKRSAADDQNENEELVEKEENSAVVCKHFVRHMYKVIWEKKEGIKKSFLFPEGPDSLFFGYQLEPDLSQEHKICLGLIHSHLYVVARKGSRIDGKWSYGVVIEKPNDDSVVVEWLKIRADGSVHKTTMNCNLAEIEKHPTFNELHEGRIVMRRKEAAKYKLCKLFKFGTVVAVQRFSSGKISVYCPLQKRIVLLWPHMLEVYVGMSMQDLIANNVVGIRINKSKLECEENRRVSEEGDEAK